MSFDPNQHLMPIKNKNGNTDYLPVQWRLVWFREMCPQGTIDTEEMEVDLDREVEEEVYVWNNEKRRSEKVVKRAKGYARYKAIVTDGKGGRATGTKSENAASFPDFVEKAETGAIGRALAGLGYGTQFAPELNEEHRIVDSPVERVASPSDSTHNGASNRSSASENATPARITEQQINSIRKLCESLGKPELEDLGRFSYLDGKTTINQLSAEYRELKEGERTKPAVTAESMNIANDVMTADQLRAIENMYKELGKPVPADVRTLNRMKAAGVIQALTSEVTVARQNKANNRAQVGAK